MLRGVSASGGQGNDVWAAVGGLRARTSLLLGEEACGRLARCGVLVAGVGGVGSFAVEAFARAGVGLLVLVDHDVVEESNLNRQLVALGSTIGRAKVDVAARRIADINPEARVVALRERVAASNARSLVDLLRREADGAAGSAPSACSTGSAASPDLCVVDCLDDVSAKVALACECKSMNVPIVAAMGAARRLDPTMFRVADLRDTRVCPLARAYRRELRERGVTRGLTVVFSEEQPVGEPGGSAVWATAACGLAVAWACVRTLLGLAPTQARSSSRWRV